MFEPFALKIKTACPKLVVVYKLVPFIFATIPAHVEKAILRRTVKTFLFLRR